MIYEKYECLEDRMLVKEIKSTESEKTEAGIILDTIKKQTRIGVVVNAGIGRHASENGTFIPCVIKAGDTVLYSANPGLPVTITNEAGNKIDCELFREGDLLMLVSKKSE
jgi:co-chaperonin GroES (HSP10)